MSQIKNNIIAKRKDFHEIIDTKNVKNILDFIDKNIDLEMLTYDDDKSLYKLTSSCLFDNIAETNDIKLIEGIINLPKFKNDPNYEQNLARILEIGFLTACHYDNVKLLEFYEKLHKPEFTQNGFNVSAVTKENGKIVECKYYFRDCLEQAVNSSYNKPDIIDFILKKKENYNQNNCNLEVHDFINTLADGTLKKSEFIYERISKEPNFLKELLVNAATVNNQPHPAILYVVFEKKMQYTDFVKSVVKDYPQIQSLFLMRELDNNLKEKNTNLPKMKI